MNAIFSYKMLTSVDDLITTCFYNYADLAVKSASKFYRTVLYTDTAGAKLFNHYKIKFDEIVILKEIEEYKGDLICMPKIYAMVKQTEPYVHLDFDTYTTCAYSTNKPIAFAYPEVNLIDRNLSPKTIEYAYKQYVQPYNRYFKDMFEEKFEVLWDWSTIPNFSTFIVNKPIIATMIYSRILKEVNGLVIDEKTPSKLATFIEQFLFGKYLDYFNIEYEYIHNYRPVSIYQKEVYINKVRLYLDEPESIVTFLQTIPFAHFSGYKKCPPFSAVVDILRENLTSKIL